MYTPPNVIPSGLFDWPTLALVVLGLMGVALAAVAGYKISVGIGMKVLGYFSEERSNERTARKVHAMTMSKPKDDIPF